MKVLTAVLSKNRKWVLAAFAASLIGVAASLIWTFYIGELVNKIEAREHISIRFLGFMGLLILGYAVSQYLSQITCKYAAEKNAHTLRVDFIKKILVFDNKISVSDAMSQMQNELKNASDYMSSTLFDIFGTILLCAFGLIFLMIVSPLMTVSIILPTVLILLFVNRSGKKIVSFANETMDRKKDINKISVGLIENYEAVSVFDSKDFMYEKYCEALEEWGKSETKLERVSAVCNSASGFMAVIPLLSLLLAGGILILNGRETVGTLIVFLNLQKTISNTIMNLPSYIASFRQFTTNLSRLEAEG